MFPRTVKSVANTYSYIQCVGSLTVGVEGAFEDGQQA